MKVVNNMEIIIEKLIIAILFLSLGQVFAIAIFAIELNSSKTIQEFEKNIHPKINIMFWLFIIMFAITLLYFQ